MEIVMPDMLVNLLRLPHEQPLIQRLEQQNIQIRRALAPDKLRIVSWVQQNSGISAAGECDVCFSRLPVSCFIATRGAKMIGYACYNAIAPDFFGPTRVQDADREHGVGQALLLRSLRAMRDEGYLYAIIGGVGPQEFYKKSVEAILIPDSTPGVYQDFLGALERTEKITP